MSKAIDKWEKAKVGCYWYYGCSTISTYTDYDIGGRVHGRGYQLSIRDSVPLRYDTLDQAARAHERLVNPIP